MAPSPISSHFDPFEIDVHSDMLLRARWDGREFDPKAVGAHLPLSKMNSTPLPCALSASFQNGLKNLSQLATIKSAALISPLSESLQNVHRKLDRSYSEPVRPQTQPNQLTTGASRYKTELCRPFAETGKCKYSDKCQFAHGQEELRSMTRHPKYKTELCRTFHSTGLCGYGTRCHFIHNEDERRPVGSPTGVSPPPSVSSPMGISCRPMGAMPFVAAEDYGVGSPTYNVAQSPYTNEPVTFNGQGNFTDQSSNQYTAGPTSPSFSIGRSSSDSFGQTPPEGSPTDSESSFFNPLFSHNEPYGHVDHSPPLAVSNDIITELSSAIYNNNINNTLEEPILDRMKLSFTCKLPQTTESPIIPFGMRDPSNSGLRLPIFKNLTKV